MSDFIYIPPNVWEFIDSASVVVGKIERDRFGAEMQSQIDDALGVRSPIEQMFLVALHVLARAHYEQVNPEPVEINGEICPGRGIQLVSQFLIEKYRVDFLVSRTWSYREKSFRDSVIVELDGHDFHDKNKRQRSYEKARDRCLTRLGYKVLHYTGSELVADPYQVAYEVMDTIECFGAVGAHPYNPTDLLGPGN